MNKALKKSLLTCLMSSVLTVSIFSGCTKTGGDQFIGTWIVQSDGTLMAKSDGGIAITKNGDSYMVTSTTTQKPFALCPTGAAYQNGKLDCGSSVSFGYQNNTDTLTIAAGLTTATLVRVK
jgi:hypothetical protein